MRFDTSRIEPIGFFKDLILHKDFSDLIFEDNYLIIYESNLFKTDILKTYLDSIQVLNDASFNNSIIKIHSKGLLKILPKIIAEIDLLKKIETQITDACKLKVNNSFSLVHSVNLESIFSADISLDPLKSAKNLLNTIRGVIV